MTMTPLRHTYMTSFPFSSTRTTGRLLKTRALLALSFHTHILVPLCYLCSFIVHCMPTVHTHDFLPLFIGSQSSQPTTPLQLFPCNFLDQHNQLLSRVMLVILFLSPIGSLSCVCESTGTDGSFCRRSQPKGTDSLSSIALLFPI
jgi:hypothetical protein